MKKYHKSNKGKHSRNNTHKTIRKNLNQVCIPRRQKYRDVANKKQEHPSVKKIQHYHGRSKMIFKHKPNQCMDTPSNFPFGRNNNKKVSTNLRRHDHISHQVPAIQTDPKSDVVEVTYTKKCRISEKNKKLILHSAAVASSNIALENSSQAQRYRHDNTATSPMQRNKYYPFRFQQQDPDKR